MELNKIKISNDATNKLKVMKSRTGFTPNILCRIGFCVSLNEPGIPDTKLYKEDGMEFNRYTLTGQYDTFLMSLLRERCLEDDLSVDVNLTEQFMGHLNRGVVLIYNRIKTISDLYKLLPIN